MVAVLAWPAVAAAETGYDLWLRYRPVEDPALRQQYRSAISQIVVQQPSATGRIVLAELRRGLSGLLGAEVAVGEDVQRDGALLVGTASGSPRIAALGWSAALVRQGRDGYVIRPARIGSHQVIVIASEGDAGALYGTFHFLRLLQTGGSLTNLDVAERPRVQRRLLDHRRAAGAGVLPRPAIAIICHFFWCSFWCFELDCSF